MIKPNAKRNDVTDALFNKGLETVIEVVKKWPGYEHIVEKLIILSVSVLYCLKHILKNMNTFYRIILSKD